MVTASDLRRSLNRAKGKGQRAKSKEQRAKREGTTKLQSSIGLLLHLPSDHLQISPQRMPRILRRHSGIVIAIAEEKAGGRRQETGGRRQERILLCKWKSQL